MSKWFHDTIVDTGRLPLFMLLVAFVLTFLFIRVSVRMIRAEVSWWPGNVSPGGVHVHHEFFGFIMMIVTGFLLVALANFHTPIANCVLAVIFGVGAALVLDEFALILHLRDVYWEEEGRTSIDAVFVAIAIGLLFLMGLRPLQLSSAVGDFNAAPDIVSRVVVIVTVSVNVVLAVITLVKGKVWTGLIGMFISPLLWVGAIRVARPRSPWARWRYANKPTKQAKSIERERRYREPLIRWKVVVQEAVAGRFGIPENLASPVVATQVVTGPGRTAPHRVAAAIRWRRTRRQLERRPWRLAVIAVLVAIATALIFAGFDDDSVTLTIDPGTAAILVGVIAAVMITLIALLLIAVTRAMQYGASQISIQVIPMLQNDRVIRWSGALFLSAFVFGVLTAADLATTPRSQGTPIVSLLVAVVLTLVGAGMLVAVFGRVTSALNASRVLGWIEAQGRTAIRREHPEHAAVGGPAATPDSDDGQSSRTRITLPDSPIRGRILQAINYAQITRLAIRWGVDVDLLVGAGDYVLPGAPVFEVRGDDSSVSTHELVNCLLFGDTYRPEVSPAVALQSISDIAVKALSPAVDDPARAVQAIDHIETLLSMLAPRLLGDQQTAERQPVRACRRGWADYVSIGTDRIRQSAVTSVQVQRRLRELLENLIDNCPGTQRPPLVERLDALTDRRADSGAG